MLLSILAQLLQIESANALLEELNDYTIPTEGRNLRQLIGFEGKEDGEPISLHQSSFSRANSNRSYRVWRYCFHCLLDYAKARYPARLEGLGKVVAVDGTLFDCLAKMAWAVYRTTKNKVKGHYFFDLNGIPDKLVLTKGSGSEIEVLANHFRAGITYIFDRGYNDYSLFRQMTKQRAFLVTRLKEGAIVNFLTNLPLNRSDSDFGIVSDQKVRLGQADNTVELRLVEWQGLDGELWRYITNRFDLSAQLIVELYNYRWQIELFFGWIKRHLQLKHWYSECENGVLIQLYAALIAFVLLKCYVTYSAIAEDMAMRIDLVRWIRRHLFDPVLAAEIEVYRLALLRLSHAKT